MHSPLDGFIHHLAFSPLLVYFVLKSRRVCPGLPVAERELWLAISRLLWSFTIHEIPGEPISLEEYEGLSGRSPLPYRVKLVPRHEHLGSILADEEEITLKF